MPDCGRIDTSCRRNKKAGGVREKSTAVEAEEVFHPLPEEALAQVMDAPSGTTPLRESR